MALPISFPKDPFAIIQPDQRWHPGEETYGSDGYTALLAPLVHGVRKAVHGWRAAGYKGATATSQALLSWWFEHTHTTMTFDGVISFEYYFAQREAIETIIYLYEVSRARDPYSLLKFDESGRVSKNMFEETWPRYVTKMATGAGKTKVASLAVAWSYFNNLYEAGSELPSNFLLIAPNIIVLDRLRIDFENSRIFSADPIVPPDSFLGRQWQSDFMLTVHIQDNIKRVGDAGNLFLTNIHRLYLSDSDVDESPAPRFLGRTARKESTRLQADLGEQLMGFKHLMVLNDEAHHIHDPSLQWFKSIEFLSRQLKRNGGALALQLDFTATPKHENGSIFVETVSDYPLVEAIYQDIVKTPVLPDKDSRAKLHEQRSKRASERYSEYLHLGYLEWVKRKKEIEATGLKPLLFVMTEDTSDCDDIAEYLAGRYPEFRGAILTIHTNRRGDVSETGSAEELDKLRRASRLVDEGSSPFYVIVSVMMLREGWDVRNVVAIIGLRPFNSKSRVLPEQTLGRGLRKMFLQDHARETLSVVGTENFLEFVEQIRAEGVELQYVPMDRGTPSNGPLVVEVVAAGKDLEELEVRLPVLGARMLRDATELSGLNAADLPRPNLPIQQLASDEAREIVFIAMDTTEFSHSTLLEEHITPESTAVLGFFVRAIRRDLRLVTGDAMIYGVVKEFIQSGLFDKAVDLNDQNILRNLAEPDVTKTVISIFREAINKLTVKDVGVTTIRNWILVSETRPFISSRRFFLVPERSLFNYIPCDNPFELEVAEFLNGCDDISFAKNTYKVGLFMEYINEVGSVATYYPDFIIQDSGKRVWILETKGREGVDDPRKIQRLKMWCNDASWATGEAFGALYAKQEDWNTSIFKSFDSFRRTFQVT